MSIVQNLLVTPMLEKKYIWGAQNEHATLSFPSYMYKLQCVYNVRLRHDKMFQYVMDFTKHL